MGLNYEEDPFIMGVFLNMMCPSKWVLFETFNTHIRVKINQVSPPPPPPRKNCPCYALHAIWSQWICNGTFFTIDLKL